MCNTIYMKSVITPEQDRFIRENYPTKGSVFCGKHLNLSPKKIGTYCSKRGIKVTKERTLQRSKENILLAQEVNKSENKDFSNFKVNPEQFLNINTKEISYILGLLWADGYVYSKGYSNTIMIECVKSDLEIIYPIFALTGEWCNNFRKRINRKEQMMIGTNNKIICNFL